MEQTVVPLTDDLVEHNEKQRAWVKGHFTEDADAKYASLDGKLRLLDAILSQKWIEPTETWKLQALGITLGDALAQKLGLEWATVDDEYGHSPAIYYPGTTLLSFPLTAISKRIEQGEDVNVYDLFGGLCEILQDMKAKGYT